MRTILLPALATLALCARGSFAVADVAFDTTAVQYSLITPPSSDETGCFGPCECPVVQQPTYGSFLLAETSVGPLYTEYDVRNYIASFNNGPGAVAIVGSGHYRLGGEVALQQELTMDVRVFDGPLVHFDSGLVPVNASFPAIDVRAAVHGFACIDTVLHVSARPVNVSGVPLERGDGIRALWPNPFTQVIRLRLAPSRGVPRSVTVVDLSGRSIRSLTAGNGADEYAWDGRLENGRSARAGVYWLCVRWAGSSTACRIAKVE